MSITETRACRECDGPIPYLGCGTPRTLCDQCWQSCSKCGEPHGADPAKRGAGTNRVCKNCRNARLREQRRTTAWHGPGRGVPRNPGPHEFLLYKVCKDCGERKPWAEFPARAYHPDGTARTVASQCHSCDQERTLARRAKDPELRARQRQFRAEWGRRRRKQLRLERAPQSGRRLPLGPFREWLALAIRDNGDLEHVARLTGFDQRTLRRSIDGSQAHVMDRVADQCFTRTGYHYNDFYGEEEVAA